MPKPKIKNLDEGQLELMWSMLQLKKSCELDKSHVQSFKSTLDKIRLAMIQKTAGQRSDDIANNSINFHEELGTIINIAVCQALELYIYGGLDKLEEVLPNSEIETSNKRRGK